MVKILYIFPVRIWVPPLFNAYNDVLRLLRQEKAAQHTEQNF
jgi:hypothetical protein